MWVVEERRGFAEEDRGLAEEHRAVAKERREVAKEKLDDAPASGGHVSTRSVGTMSCLLVPTLCVRMLPVALQRPGVDAAGASGGTSRRSSVGTMRR